MKNLEQFNQITVWALGNLYDNFPKPLMLQVEDFDPEFDRNMQESFGATIEFLESEGFLRITDKYDDGTTFGQVTLTMKALNALNSIPESIKEGKSLGQKMSEIAKKGSLETFKSVVGELVKYGIGG